jgi:AcrR family transcriptional regulator
MSRAVCQQANEDMSRHRNQPIVDAEADENVRKIRRTHAERREEAEQRMLDAAVRIVAEHGLEYLTLAECGEAAGYSRGLAAHYFGSKDSLISEIATHIVANYAQRLRGSSGGRKGLDGYLYSIGFYIDNGRNRMLELRAFNAVLGSSLTNPKISGAIADLNRRSVDAFAEGLRICIKQGSVRPDIDPVAEATLALSMLRGLMSQWLIDPQGVDLDAAKAELLESLRRSLSPQVRSA